MRQALFFQHHDDLNAEHFEYHRTLQLLRKKYHWVKMTEDVKQYVTSCDMCFSAKTTRHKSYELLQFFSISEESRRDWTMNFITNLPSSKYENNVFNVILIVINRYFKFSYYFSSRKNWIAERLADVLWHRIFSLTRESESIVCDKDKLFTFDYWSKLCYCLNIKTKKKHCFSFSNEWTNKTSKLNSEAIFTLLC